MIMNPITSALFSLLRIAIGKERTASFPVELDWSGLVDIAFNQSAAAMIADGVQEVNDCFPDLQLTLDDPSLEPLKYELLAEPLAAEQDYARYKASIASLAKFLGENGVSMMLLKGYGLSLNYPVPDHRPCGDIDIYCARKPGKVDYLVKEKLGIEVLPCESHHSSFKYEDWTVENHYSFMDTDNYRSNFMFEKELMQLEEECREEIEIDGVKFFIPAPTLMVVHLVRHAGSDFASNTITLRQLLDWALLIDKRSADIDWPIVESIVDRMGMRGFFDMMNDLSVNALGIESEKFPNFKSDAGLRERAIEDILYAPRVCDFPDYHKKLAYGIAKTRQAWNNRWKCRLVFNESFLSLYWQKAINRLKH